MKDANDLVTLALQMYRLLERGPSRKDGDGRNAYASLTLIEKGAVMGIVNALFQGEIQEQMKLKNEEREQRQQPAGWRSPAIADEYQQ